MMDLVQPSHELAENTTLNSSTPSDSLTPRSFHLDVTRTIDNRTLPVKSPEWRQLRSEILLRDNNTCATCGYICLHPAGRGMKVDHKNGDASDNDPSNLRVHCPPCEAIRHCGLHGMLGYIVLGASDLDQVEIIRKTREIFEESGMIPRHREVDPLANPADISIVDFANILLEKDWDDMPDEYRRFKGFFTKQADKLFSVTKYSERDNHLVAKDVFHSDSDVRARQIVELESSLPWIVFSSQEHGSLPRFMNTWKPSTAKNIAWICVSNSKTQPLLDDASDTSGLIEAWEDSCAKDRASVEEIDRLAREYNVMVGKWLVFVDSDKVDDLWFRIARSTHAGTLGSQAKVSPSYDSAHETNSRHVICVFTSDYTDLREINHVRDSLRRLGVKDKIGYKPDAYTHCRVYLNNPWNIRPTRYQI